MNSLHTTKMAIMLGFLLAVPAPGAENNDWARVEGLPRGARIGVVRTDQKRVEGRFAGADGGGVMVDGAGIRKEDVVRVYRIGMSRKKRMLIGAAAGVGAGAAVAVGVAGGTNGEGVFGGAGGGAVAAVGGAAGIGVAVGALTGGGYQTVYQKGK